MVVKKSDGDTEAISLRLHGLSTDEVREMEKALREIIRNA
jgi:Cys-tRNA synthase (O-phospho-L-seryl-tRNA:Cys-tRNA synthase)